MDKDELIAALRQEIINLRAALLHQEGRPVVTAPEADLPALMTLYALEASGFVLRASDTGAEWTLMGSRGWVRTYTVPGGA